MILDDMEYKDMFVDWMKFYKLEELFDENGVLVEKVVVNILEGDCWMVVNLIINGGVNLKEFVMFNYCDFVVDVKNYGIEMY